MKSGEFINPYIYCFFDKIKNKIIYVGKTNGRDKTYRTGSKILKRFISLFGYDHFDNRFDRRIIEYCTLEELDLKEEYYINFYNTINEGVNLTKGGKYDWKRVNYKPILQYDLNGNFIKEWGSGIEALEKLNLTDYNGISAVCKGNQPTSGGYIWRYKTLPIPLKIEEYKRKQYKKRTGGGGAIRVTIKGIIYNSKTEAMKKLKIGNNTLNKLLYEEKNKILSPNN